MQTLSAVAVFLHFFKREIETIFVHRFSASTMPARNVVKNSAYYWILTGLFMAYFIYGPESAAAEEENPFLSFAGLVMFFAGELCNLATHLTLRNLRSSGGKERGIPDGLGFNLVTCPNYMFEIIAWVGITLVTRSWATAVFNVVAIIQMGVWAKKRERNYRKEFGDKYKSKKYASLPLIY